MAPDVEMCSCCPPWEKVFEKERGENVKLIVVPRATPRFQALISVKGGSAKALRLKIFCKYFRQGPG